MKIIAFSDLHVHNYQKFDESGSRLNNCLKVIEEVFELASDHNADLITFSGDLTDQWGKLPTVVVNGLLSTFKRCFERHNKYFVSITGNHDLAYKSRWGQPVESTQAFLAEAFPKYLLIDNKTVKVKGIVIHGIPYYEEVAGTREDLLTAFDNIPTGLDLLLIHQTPKGVDMPYEVPVGNQYNQLTLCGHIHIPQIVNDNLYVLGSPLHRDFGDAGQDKYVWLIEDYKVKEQIILDYPVFSRTDNESPYYENRAEVDVKAVKIDLQMDKVKVYDQYLLDQEITDSLIIQAGLSCL